MVSLLKPAFQPSCCDTTVHLGQAHQTISVVVLGSSPSRMDGIGVQYQTRLSGDQFSILLFQLHLNSIIHNHS